MAQLWEYIKMAVSNIRMNRGRSFLTMLGIIIGVSSVILIMSIGNGAKAEMEEELTSVAGGQVYISVNSNLESDTPVITEEDRDALRELEHVKGASSVMNQWSAVATERAPLTPSSITATRTASISPARICCTGSGLPGTTTMRAVQWRWCRRWTPYVCSELPMW